VAGGKFTLENNPADPDDGAYYVRGIGHTIRDDSWIAGDGQTSYTNDFTAVPAATTYRDRPVSPRPIATGIHTGIVLGPQNDVGGTVKMQDGEEILTDDLARVRVRFFWDHRAESTGSASAWARVVQPWAGNGWGAQFLPRVGTEVAVAFVDGDPDQPIVLGGLYNGVSAPIYAVADKTKSGFRTRSSLKGDASKFNELTFDDKSGSELIFIHAEKDLTTEVEHDESLTVDNCRVVLVKADETITVKGKETVSITKDYTFEVTEGNSAVKVTTGNHAFEVSQGDRTVKVAAGNDSFEVSKGNYAMKVGKGNHSTEVSMGNHDLKVSLGNITVKAGVGSISMEALQGIELKVGANSLKIDMMGVTINGMMVKIAGTVMTDVKGLMTKVGGDAMLMLKGAITMIN
jgi:type VI secretion system secreted protein VgrG